jgi:hypothetical protein
MSLTRKLVALLRKRAPDPTAEDLHEIATHSGIADVDPEPLSQVAGEGIDLDRDVEAHESIRDLRERLP